MNLYRPTDVQAANVRFGATCGHAALAAILGREVTDVWQSARHAFAGRGYVSSFAMQDALRTLYPMNWRRAQPGARLFPVRGLALLQFEGPWMAKNLPLGAQLSRTHWVAVDRIQNLGESVEMVYDINVADWFPTREWQSDVLSLLLANHKRATGWHVIHAFEVQPKLLKSDATIYR